MIKEKCEWVPEDLDRLEHYAKLLKAMTVADMSKLDAFTCSMIGFSFSRAVMELRAARADGFAPRGAPCAKEN